MDTTGLQEILKLLMKQLDFLKSKLEILANLGYKYVGGVIYALKLITTTIDNTYLNGSVQLFENIVDNGILKNGLQLGVGLNTPDFNQLFNSCPFLKELFGPISNKNLSVGVKLDFGGVRTSLNDILEKYKNTIEEVRSVFRSITDAVTEKALYLLYQYELFLIKSGVFDLLSLIEKIYNCLQNLYNIAVAPEENLLNSMRPKLMINNSEIDLIAIANNSDVTSGSLTSVYSSYRQRMMPVIPLDNTNKANSYITQIRNSISIF